jgi:hypothetical protein
VQIQQNPSRKPKLWWRKQGASGRVSISLSPSEEQDLLDTAQLTFFKPILAIDEVTVIEGLMKF